MLLSTEIFSKRRKIYACEEKPELISKCQPSGYIIFHKLSSICGNSFATHRRYAAECSRRVFHFDACVRRCAIGEIMCCVENSAITHSFFSYVFFMNFATSVIIFSHQSREGFASCEKMLSTITTTFFAIFYKIDPCQFMQWKLFGHWLSDAVGCARTTKTGRIGYYRVGHTEDLKNSSLLAAVQPRARRWWVGAKIYAEFTTKTAAWHTAQVNRDGRRRPLVTLRKECRKQIQRNLTELKQARSQKSW